MLLAAAALFSCALNGTNAPDSTATREYHVRTIDPRVREWIALGAAGSRTFSKLLNRLAASDVIVYITIVDRVSSGAEGHIFFVTSTDTARYLRIEMEDRGHAFDKVSVLGHELQHAVEIADAPRVRDSGGLATMYLRVGDPSRWYDSIAARATGERIRDELARASALRGDRNAAHTGPQ